MAGTAAPRWFVTGIDGPIGRAVARLIVHRGDDVVGWQPSETPSREEREGVVIVRGPVDDELALRGALRGVTHVVHTLIDTRSGADYDDLAPINLDLAERVFAEARRAGVAVVVVLGEARVYGPADRYVSEEGEVRPSDVVGRSLYDAEIQLRGLANRHPSAPRLVVLRRARLYGHSEPPPESPWWALPPVLGSFFELVPGLAGGPRLQWVHLDDLARAALHVATIDDDRRTSTFNVADDTPLTMGELFNLVIEAYGFPLGIKVPYPSRAMVRRILPVVDQPLARSSLDVLLKRLWRAATAGDERPAEPAFAEASLWGLGDDLLIANNKLKETGFTLTYPDLRRGLRDVIESWQRRGLVPSEQRRGAGAETRRPTRASTFAEIMRGHFVTEPGGARHPISFQVRLAAPGVRLPVMENVWHLDGRLTAESLAVDTPIRGTLEVSPYSKRRLSYEFGFEGDDGRQYRLAGVKTLRWRDLKRSLTEMTITIIDDSGAEIAAGEMRFDLRHDLFDFVRSFKLTREFPTSPSDRIDVNS